MKQYDYLILEKQNTKRAKVDVTELKQDGNVKDTEKEMLIKENAELKAIISSLKAILKEVNQMSKEQKIYCIIGRAVSILFGCSVVAGVILATLYYALFCQKGGKYMEAILGCLAGIFVGFTAGGYMLLQPIADKDKLIEEQKEENLQVYSENKELRAEIEDLKFELSVANKEIEQKDEIVKKMKIIINDFMTKEDKLNKLKELADDYQSIN